jgi:predicted nucleotidyltransferase component of viral defense system
MMANSFLTPLQRAFLRAFFGDPVGRYFFLTGGTALAAFHLHHRLSDDLDLFTLDNLALDAAVRPIESVASDLNCTLQHTRVSQYFQQFLLTHLAEVEPVAAAR